MSKDTSSDQLQKQIDKQSKEITALTKTVIGLQRGSKVKDKRISQLNTNVRELQALVNRMATQLKQM
jgi:septal ring factor EnvC (AmiA/AmiB activator)